MAASVWYNEACVEGHAMMIETTLQCILCVTGCNALNVTEMTN
jgi:hypothetical protein